MTKGFTPYYFGDKNPDNLILIQKLPQLLEEQSRQEKIESFITVICFILLIVLCIFVYNHRDKIQHFFEKLFLKLKMYYCSLSRVEKLLTVLIGMIFVLILIICAYFFRIY